MASVFDRARAFLAQPIAPTPSIERAALAVRQSTSSFAVSTHSEIKQRTHVKDARSLREFSNSNEFVRVAINRRRRQVAQADWALSKFDGSDADPGVQAYVYRLFAHCNDRGESFRQLLDFVVEDILVLDKGCIELDRDLLGRIVGLYAVDGGSIVIDPDWNGEPYAIRYRQIVRGDVVAQWTNDDFICIQANPRTYNVEGFSPVETLMRTIEAESFASLYEYEMLKQTAPEGLITLGNVSPQEVDAFKAFYLSELAGKRGVGIAGGSDNVNFLPFKGSAREGQRAEYRGQLARKIAAVFEVDPLLFGFSDNANRSISETMQAQTDEGYKSLATVVSEAISRNLIQQISAEHFFQFTNLTSRDEKTQADIDKTRITIGVDTINEVRDRDGKAPVAWGDEPPANVTGTDVPPIAPSRLSIASAKLAVPSRAIAVPSIVKARKARTRGGKRVHVTNTKAQRALVKHLDRLIVSERSRIKKAFAPYREALMPVVRRRIEMQLQSRDRQLTKALADSEFFRSLRDLPGALVSIDAFKDAVHAGRGAFPLTEDDESLDEQIADLWASKARFWAEHVPGRIAETIGDTIDEEADETDDPQEIEDAVDEQLDTIEDQVQRYGDAVYAPGEAAYGKALQDAEILVVWHCVEDAASCEQCPELAALGPQVEFDAWPGDNVQCRTNCRCEIRASAESWEEAIGAPEGTVIDE